MDEVESKTSILMELNDEPGALHEILKFFWKYDIDITSIESRPTKHDGSFEFFVDFVNHTDAPVNDKLLGTLRQKSRNLMVLDDRRVPWFPRHISDLDVVGNRILDAGTDLESDHPGFNDPVYRSRRQVLAENAMKHRYGEPIPRIDYTPEEVATWGAVYDKLTSFLEEHACPEYLRILPLLNAHCCYNRDTVPQQDDISRFLQRGQRLSLGRSAAAGTTLLPVAVIDPRTRNQAVRLDGVGHLAEFAERALRPRHQSPALSVGATIRRVMNASTSSSR